MLTHWSPIRSTQRITCSSAATMRAGRRPPAPAGPAGTGFLVDLEVAAVDPGVVGHDHGGELDVLVGDRLERAIQLLDDQVQAVERLRLERCQVVMESMARFLHAGKRYPTVGPSFHKAFTRLKHLGCAPGLSSAGTGGLPARRG